MPTDWEGYKYRPKTWRTMDRHQRKQFYRDNETRISRGLKSLEKP